MIKDELKRELLTSYLSSHLKIVSETKICLCTNIQVNDTFVTSFTNSKK